MSTCACKECRPDLYLSCSSKNVHATKFISDCDIQLLCTNEWAFPSESKEDDEVFYTENRMYMYTKEKERVSCKSCLEKMNAAKPIQAPDV